MSGQEAIRRASRAAQQAMKELDQHAIEELATLYETTTGNIIDAIAKISDGDGHIDFGDLADLLKEINAHLSELSTAQSENLMRHLNRAAQLGTAPFEPALGAELVGRMNFEAVRFVREFQAADGLRLSDRIWRIDRGAQEAVNAAVQGAVIRGNGAAQAAREFLNRKLPVPADAQLAMQAGSAQAITAKVEDVLLTGAESPLNSAMRVFRTEINRAHGTAYQMSAEAHPDAVGTRFMLSPRHPRVDICDMHARANLHGLGEGVYPHGKNPWPAHPNTLSFVIVVFKDEVTPQDVAGKQTVEQFLETVPREQRQGILGKNKNEAFEAGELSAGMVKSRWKDVQARIGPRHDLRDQVTRQFFNQRVSFPDGVPDIAIGGKPLTRDQMARLAGAPDGARIYFSRYGDRPGLEIEHPFYKAPSHRSFFRTDDGGLGLSNDLLMLKSDKAPKGFGLRIFGTQAQAAQELGFKRIEIYAARSSNMNGYHAWPQYGANADLPEKILRKLPPGLQGARDLLDLMGTDAGRAFWKKEGYSIECNFDLTEGSRSWQQLIKQLTAKKISLSKWNGLT
ncbi:hypothetical protein EDC30_10988 [Paucimonas lemoignei]|uniref:EF-hand domain-containing protein n=1 Tax=Paucimonas lemoignei TaxID=29443 RepID=A0A4R3HWM1_PAULE|nr:hypothetical protein [Paucimonas lemoignei]TCS35789.1 hypothetical protein EDC30_10988 [Paucimonas lemoignei]